MDRLEARVLFISYNGMLDPLGQSQVLPYLKGLAGKGVQFHLLSFERAAALTADGRAKTAQLKTDLSRQNIQWHTLRYHQTPSLPATSYDVIHGIRVAQRLIKQNKIELVHARSHIPATIATALKKLTGIKMIFDIRGLMAEEYVEADHWRAGSLAHRVTKRMETNALAAADGVVTLTNKIWPVVQEWNGLRGREVIHEVIPCCADLETFSFSDDARRKRRAELRLNDRLTLVYSGSIGSWYLASEMADFFVQIRKRRNDLHFLWLTPGSPELIDKIMRERGVASEAYSVRRVMPADMPSYLSAADVGIAFYKPGLSKLATSPVKVTEYLACGLPVVLNSGIGDSDEIMSGKGVGAVVSRFEQVEYVRAWGQIEECLVNVNQTRSRARELARTRFDLDAVGCASYLRLYVRVLGKN